jgi:hypothetical protein
MTVREALTISRQELGTMRPRLAMAERSEGLELDELRELIARQEARVERLENACRNDPQLWEREVREIA